jgi:putative transposase
MRKARQLKNDASYHVTARVNRQESIFEEKDIKELFLAVMKEAKKKYKFQIINFSIMNNHIHLMIKPGKNENLSRILQWILSVFAVRFNKIFNYRAHVFYDRFHSKIINNMRQYIDTYKYIADNPVKADLVRKCEDYKYGGVWHAKFKIFDILEPPSPLIKQIIKKLSESEFNH